MPDAPNTGSLIGPRGESAGSGGGQGCLPGRSPGNTHKEQWPPCEAGHVPPCEVTGAGRLDLLLAVALSWTIQCSFAITRITWLSSCCTSASRADGYLLGFVF